MLQGLRGGSVVKSLPSYAGDVSSIPGSETKIPHAAGQLSLSPTAREPMGCNEDPEQPKKKKGRFSSILG